MSSEWGQSDDDRVIRALRTERDTLKARVAEFEGMFAPLNGVYTGLPAILARVKELEKSLADQNQQCDGMNCDKGEECVRLAVRVKELEAEQLRSDAASIRFARDAESALKVEQAAHAATKETLRNAVESRGLRITELKDETERLKTALEKVSETHENSRRAASKGSNEYSGAFLWALYGADVSAALAPPAAEAKPEGSGRWECSKCGDPCGAQGHVHHDGKPIPARGTR